MEALAVFQPPGTLTVSFLAGDHAFSFSRALLAQVRQKSPASTEGYFGPRGAKKPQATFGPRGVKVALTNKPPSRP
jgi:hypothetical protein